MFSYKELSHKEIIQGISYNYPILQLKWAYMSIWELQFHIEEHKEKFPQHDIMRKVNLSWTLQVIVIALEFWRWENPYKAFSMLKHLQELL